MCKIIMMIILCVQFCFSHQRVKKQLAGPFDLELERVEKCADQGSALATLVPYRFIKTTGFEVSYSGTLILGRPFGEKFSILVTIDVWGNGGWKNNLFMQHFDDPCNYTKEIFPKWMEVVFKYANITDCPIPAGNYTVDDVRIDLKPKTIIPPYGKYKIELVQLYERERIGCGCAYFEVVPRAAKTKKPRKSPQI